ncbi:MAG: hypothetical protein JXB45_02315 [Candidatus Krumholzibacteriota bacterium]|nr:hypothetical protein [Candidatus Krumholzibacteriota bacterium]
MLDQARLPWSRKRGGFLAGKGVALEAEKGRAFWLEKGRAIPRLTGEQETADR